MKKLLVDCSIVPNPSGDFIKNGYLAVKDGKISSLGPYSSLPSSLGNWPRESLDGDLVLPGLINTHTHIPMALLRGWAEDLSLKDWLERTRRFREKFYNEEVVRLAARLALVELIQSGVTTFADMSVGQDIYLDIVRKSGLRAVLFETLMEYVYPEHCGKLIEFLNGSGQDNLISRGAALHAPYSSTEEIFHWFKKEVKHKHDPLTSIHLAETEGEIEICRQRFGSRPVEILQSHGLLDKKLVAIHGVFLNQEELELLSDRSVKLSHNPECNMKIGAGVAPVDRALKAGMTVALGTDSQASNNDQDMFGEMQSAACMQKVARRDPRVLPARKVFEMATTGAARALGLENKVGRLEAGLKADLVVVDFNRARLRPVFDPLSLIIYCLHGSDVKHSMVAGRWLMKENEVRVFDEQKVINEVENRFQDFEPSEL